MGKLKGYVNIHEQVSKILKVEESYVLKLYIQNALIFTFCLYSTLKTTLTKIILYSVCTCVYILGSTQIRTVVKKGMGISFRDSDSVIKVESALICHFNFFYK